ncbi:MAG: arginine deiminase-related protein [Nanoarchaeota archaeon]|nr:arginine deiminase-related protein [Nanoarchaeota archaeon]
MTSLESKVRLVTRNTDSKFSVKERGLYVLVGIPEDADDTLEERQDVADAISKKGFNVVEVNCHWPRDKYVWFKNSYVHSHPYYDEGGCFVFGKTYFVASADKDIYWDYRIRRIKQMETIEDRLKEIHDSDFYMIPSLKRRGQDPEMHLDLSISIIESRNLMLVDSRHYRQQKRIFEKIAYERSQKVVLVNSEDEARLWPMNILILDCKGKTTAVANANCRKVLKALNKHDIDIITVPITNLPSLGGSIRCITNTVECLSVYNKIKGSVEGN